MREWYGPSARLSYLRRGIVLVEVKDWGRSMYLGRLLNVFTWLGGRVGGFVCRNCPYFLSLLTISTNEQDIDSINEWDTRYFE